MEAVDRVKSGLAWVGAVEVVGEEALDAVAAVALGGAGFACNALVGLEEGAVREGLPREIARAFVQQTALATALLLTEHLGSPADLKDRVASPGGTTITALAGLEDAGARGAFIRAVQRAAASLRERRHPVRVATVE
jgi:pyrroline-5-carboxylate reductase